MTLPTMPGTHTWVQGGPMLAKAGRAALYGADGDAVWVWDEETGLQVTDLRDAGANTVSTATIVDGRVDGIGVPVAVRFPSFSVGQYGPHYYSMPVQTIIAAITAGAANDTAVANLVTTGGSATDVALKGVYETGAAKIIYVSPSGNDSRNGRTLGTAKATIGAALTAMGTSLGKIVLDNGAHPVTGTLAWPSNAKCGLVGQGPANTTIAASSQTGPVLDLTAVGYGLNGAEFGGFTLQGDGTAGSAKKGLALSSTTSVVRGNFHDINVLSTGGAPFDLGMAELCTFDRLAPDAPVSAAANDIPYLTATGAFNGNRINGLCLSATVTGSATVGPSGAVVIKDNGSTAPHDNKIEAPQIEGLRCPTNATVFALAGNSTVVADLQIFDAGKVSGATGTSYFRLTAPAVTDLGGNIIRGVIPGKGTNATDMDTGVDMRQSRNSVHGIKGYKGTNVTLASGVVSCDVDLKGAVSTATDAAVVDNSGNGTNTVRDTYMSVIGGNGTGNRLIKSGGYYGPANHVPGTIATTAGNMMAIPVWIPAAMTAVSIECQVTVAGVGGTVVRMGIYSPGTADNPATLVLDAGTQPADTTGVKAITISQPLSAGLYWLTACPQGGNPTFISVGSGSLSPVAPASFGGGNNCYYVASVAGAFPSTFGSVSPFTGGIKVMVKAA